MPARAGVVQVELEDVFDEHILDAHLAAIGAFVSDDDDTNLREFAGIEVGGHQLISSRDDWDALIRTLRAMHGV